jgi:hypothetical protein
MVNCGNYKINHNGDLMCTTHLHVVAYQVQRKSHGYIQASCNSTCVNSLSFGYVEAR